MNMEEKEQRVMDALKYNDSWVRSSELTEVTGVEGARIREIANKSGKLISSQRGYKRADMASPKEVHEHVAVLCSRARAITDRANRILEEYA